MLGQVDFSWSSAGAMIVDDQSAAVSAGLTLRQIERASDSVGRQIIVMMTPGARSTEQPVPIEQIPFQAFELGPFFARQRSPFVAAIWSIDSKELILIRDHLGQIPFFYHFDGDERIAFADSLKVLLDHISATRRIDRRRLAEFLRGDYADTSATFFEAVQRVPPAHLTRLRSGRLERERYWSPSPEPRTAKSDEEWASQFRRRFSIAVSRNLQGATAPAVLLSGGIDSSAVACVAARQAQSVRSLTFIYGGQPDERDWVNAVVPHCGLDAHWLDVMNVDPLRGVGRLVDLLGEPFENPGLVVASAAAERLADIGADRVLDGTLGDSVVSYDPCFMAAQFRRAPLSALREAVLYSRHMYGAATAPWTVIKDAILRPLLRMPEAAAEVVELMHPDLAAEQQRPRARRAERITEAVLVRRHCAEASGALSMRSLEVRRQLLGEQRLEPGHPYADIDLIQFALSLPADQKVRHGLTRFIVRQALRDRLPEKILRRGGKWSPIGTQCRRFSRLPIGELDDTIRSGPGMLEGLVRWEPVIAALNELRNDPEHFRPSALISLWLGFILLTWATRFAATS